jgi:hypothetical protein
VQIDYGAPGWNGCVLPLKAEAGTILAVTVKNVNVKKYRVKIAGESTPLPKEAVPDAFAAFLGTGAIATEAQDAEKKAEKAMRTEREAEARQQQGAEKVRAAMQRQQGAAAQIEASRSKSTDRLLPSGMEIAARRELEAAQRELEAAQRELEAAQRELEAAQRELEAATKVRADAEAELHRLQARLDPTSLNGLLEQHRQTYEALQKDVEAAAHAARAVTTAADYAALVDALAAAFKELKECSAATATDDQGRRACADALANRPVALDDHIRKLARLRRAVGDASDDQPELHRTLRDLLEDREEKARQAVAAMPDQIKALATYLRDRSGTEKSLFSDTKTFDFTGDELRIDVVVQSGPEKEPVTEFAAKVVVTTQRREGFAFSTGMFFTGLVDRSYTTTPAAEGEPSTIVRKGDEDELRPAIGILAHWLFDHHWAATAGFTGKDTDLQYLAGVSYLWGSKQRFVLTAGAAIGSVTRLDRVSEGDEWTEKEVPTKDVSSVSWLVGVSFKF